MAVKGQLYIPKNLIIPIKGLLDTPEKVRDAGIELEKYRRSL